MDFKSAKELLGLCQQHGLPISEVMRRRECELGETTPEAVNARMVDAWAIMTASATQPLHHPVKSMGGLIGGEAGRLSAHLDTGRSLCGGVLGRAVMYAMAVLEVNASMGLDVAAPTAGSAGVVPGLLLALQQQYSLPDEKTSWMPCSMPVRWGILLCAMPRWPVPWAAVRPKWVWPPLWRLRLRWS